MEDGVEVFDRHLVPAVGADVLGAIRGHIHLVPAAAVGEAGKEVDDALGRTLSFGPLLIEHHVALVPEIFRNDSFDLVKYPLTFGLQLPCLLAPGRLGVVRAADALPGGVAQQAIDGRVGEGRAVACAIPA